MRISEVVRIQQRALGEDAAEAVGNPNDGVPLGALALAVKGKSRDQGLSMVMDEVVTGIFDRSLPETPIDVGVVPVHQDIGMLLLQRRRQQVGGPVHSVRGLPCLLWSAVQAVDEDDVGFGLRVSVHGCKLEPSRVLVDGGLVGVLVYPLGFSGGRDKPGKHSTASRFGPHLQQGTIMIKPDPTQKEPHGMLL